MRACKNCKYYKRGVCDLIGWDDDKYPHNNSKGFGIKAYALDDSGMQVELRVDEDFYCKYFTKG